MCDCAEERDRRARERARKAADARRVAAEAQMSDSDLYDGEPPPSRFSAAQIALGTVGFLLALMALMFKNADNDILYVILSKFGLGHLVRNEKKNAPGPAPAIAPVPAPLRDACIDPNRKKWHEPPPPPPKPTCKQKPKCP